MRYALDPNAVPAPERPGDRKGELVIHTWRVTCQACDTTEDVSVAMWQQAVVSLRGLGWRETRARRDARRWLCPACVARRKQVA